MSKRVSALWIKSKGLFDCFVWVRVRVQRARLFWETWNVIRLKGACNQSQDCAPLSFCQLHLLLQQSWCTSASSVQSHSRHCIWPTIVVHKLPLYFVFHFARALCFNLIAQSLSLLSRLSLLSLQSPSFFLLHPKRLSSNILRPYIQPSTLSPWVFLVAALLDSAHALSQHVVEDQQKPRSCSPYWRACDCRKPNRSARAADNIWQSSPVQEHLERLASSAEVSESYSNFWFVP